MLKTKLLIAKAVAGIMFSNSVLAEQVQSIMTIMGL